MYPRRQRGGISIVLYLRRVAVRMMRHFSSAFGFGLWSLMDSQPDRLPRHWTGQPHPISEWTRPAAN
jgi:hypothetical protein